MKLDLALDRGDLSRKMLRSGDAGNRSAEIPAEGIPSIVIFVATLLCCNGDKKYNQLDLAVVL